MTASKEKKAGEKRKPSRAVSFTTKTGKEISFKPTGERKKNAQAKLKVEVKGLNKKISALEKAVLKYNQYAVSRSKSTKDEKSKGGKPAKRQGGGKANDASESEEDD